MRFKEYLTEIFNSTKPKLVHERPGKSRIYELNLPDNTVTFTVAAHQPGWWVFYFKGEDEDGNETFGATGKGNEFKIFGAAKWILDELIRDYGPRKIEMEGEVDDEADDPEKRPNLYRKFFEKYKPRRYKVVERNNEGQSVYFTLTRI
jgi:hypothetical protein